MKFLKVKSVTSIKSEPIYHMTVEKNHNFFANGLCVHNCGYRGAVAVILCYEGVNPFGNNVLDVMMHVKDVEQKIIGGFKEDLEYKNPTFVIKRGDRIAQLVIAQVPAVEVQFVTELDETDRGTGGFGSTGKA